MIQNNNIIVQVSIEIEKKIATNWKTDPIENSNKFNFFNFLQNLLKRAQTEENLSNLKEY